MDHACPHRCASLFYGRNEPGGLRCVYHGWKYAPDGQCLEQPNVPPEHSFAPRLKAQAYPCVERNGVVWTYMGGREVPPPLTGIEATLLPEGDVRLSCSLRRCNYLQVLEGEIEYVALRLPAWRFGGRGGPRSARPTVRRCATARRAITWPKRARAACMHRIARWQATRSITASRTSCCSFYTQFPDGNFEGTSCSTRRCRWTTSIR